MTRHNNINESEELYLAAQNGNITQIEKALAEGADPNFTNRMVDGSPYALHETTRIDDEIKGLECTKKLLENGANTASRTLTTKNTPLHEAASNGKEQICRLLIENQERDEDISIEESNAYGNTQLHTAVTAGNVDIVRLLIEKDFDINAQNHIGSNALHICAFLATAITKDEINSKEALQKSATKSLMVQPHLQIAAILLSNKNFKMLNEKDHNGQTSLHIASQRGCNEMVKLLVDSGADISIRTSIDAKGRGGRNAKDVAQFAGMTDTYNLLNDIEHCIEKYVSKTLATDIQTGYSISNPIVGSGALGLRKNSKTH